MARYRLHHSLGRRHVIRTLYRWTRKYLHDGKRCIHQKISDAMLIAIFLARFVFKQPHPSVWWSMLKADRPGLPSYTQAYTRSLKLLQQLEALATPSRRCQEV